MGATDKSLFEIMGHRVDQLRRVLNKMYANIQMQHPPYNLDNVPDEAAAALRAEFLSFCDDTHHAMAEDNLLEAFCREMVRKNTAVPIPQLSHIFAVKFIATKLNCGTEHTVLFYADNPRDALQQYNTLAATPKYSQYPYQWPHIHEDETTRHVEQALVFGVNKWT